MQKTIRKAALLSIVAFGLATAVVPSNSQLGHYALAAAKTDKAGKAGKGEDFAPVAPAGTLLSAARVLHKRAAAEAEADTVLAVRLSIRMAEWINVQAYRDDPKLADWAKKQAAMYIAAAEAEEGEAVAAKLTAANKGWAEYDKNAKTWATAKPKAGAHARVSKELTPLMAFFRDTAAQSVGKVDAAVKKGDISGVTDDLLIMAETANILQSDRSDPKWKELASNLREASLHLIEIGKKGDRTALKPGLNEIQKACNDCHGSFRK